MVGNTAFDLNENFTEGLAWSSMPSIIIIIIIIIVNNQLKLLTKVDHLISRGRLRFSGCRRLLEDWGSVLCKVIQGVEYCCDESHVLEEW